MIRQTAISPVLAQDLTHGLLTDGMHSTHIEDILPGIAGEWQQSHRLLPSGEPTQPPYDIVASPPRPTECQTHRSPASSHSSSTGSVSSSHSLALTLALAHASTGPLSERSIHLGSCRSIKVVGSSVRRVTTTLSSSTHRALAFGASPVHSWHNFLFLLVLSDHLNHLFHTSLPLIERGHLNTELSRNRCCLVAQMSGDDLFLG